MILTVQLLAGLFLRVKQNSVAKQLRLALGLCSWRQCPSVRHDTPVVSFESIKGCLSLTAEQVDCGCEQSEMQRGRGTCK